MSVWPAFGPSVGSRASQLAAAGYPNFGRLLAGVRPMNVLGRPLTSGLQVEHRTGEPVQLVGLRGDGEARRATNFDIPSFDRSRPRRAVRRPRPEVPVPKTGPRPRRCTGCQAHSGRRGPGRTGCSTQSARGRSLGPPQPVAGGPGDPRATPDDILAALLDEPTGLAARILDDLAVNRQAVLAAPFGEAKPSPCRSVMPWCEVAGFYRVQVRPCLTGFSPTSREYRPL